MAPPTVTATKSRTMILTNNDRHTNGIHSWTQPMPTIFYAIPLSVSISLVYCATRYEMPSCIFRSAAAMFVKILIGMTIIYGVLSFFSW